MRIASSMGMMKIRPSPISPVCADLMLSLIHIYGGGSHTRIYSFTAGFGEDDLHAAIVDIMVNSSGGKMCIRDRK